MGSEQPFETSDDAVLGGRLRLRQPVRGHRVGHDAILLAAATGAHAGEHAVDLGAGVGGAGLALAVRVPELKVTLVEIDAALCALASGNAERNGVSERVSVIACDVEDVGALAAAGLVPGSIDHVLMNPPFNDARRQNVSPDPRRRLAHVAAPGLLARWVAAASWLLKPKGTLTLIWRADGLDEVLAALSDAFGDAVVLPVYPRAGAPAIRVLVRAIKAGQPAARADLPGLVLNGNDGKPTAAAEVVLRHATSLALA
ncbi:MAG TPA: methyltransferase [Pseudolabrys sp.]|jgi:tRNA1(Val) A37 N6-methylase TrmN6